MGGRRSVDFSGNVRLINFFNILDDTVAVGGSGSSASPATMDLVQVENASLG
jgi:hypothetical protein